MLLQVVYFGDSLCSDSFPAKTYAGWDVVLVLEEMEAEGYHLTRHDLDCDDERPASKVRKTEVRFDRNWIPGRWGDIGYELNIKITDVIQV